MKLKRIEDQVVVVVGASSGIGRESALRFGARGAKVVVAARSAPGLTSLVEEITAAGGEAVPVVCDVAEPAQVQQVAAVAEEAYGRVDTWANVAATSVFATFEDTTPEEFRRVMEVNYLGQVHGMLAALPALRRAGGGALIAVSSVEALVSLPMHAAYSASKHAVEGAVDALRRELRAERAPISVTSVKPGTINTPFFANARNKMDVAPKGPPPWYQPKVVADCLLYAAEHPVRDLYAGGGGRQMAFSQTMMPHQVDLVLGRIGIPATRTHRAEPAGSEGNLYASRDDDRVQGDFSGRARGFSLYTWARLHRPTAIGLVTAAATAGPAALRRAVRADRG